MNARDFNTGLGLLQPGEKLTLFRALLSRLAEGRPVTTGELASSTGLPEERVAGLADRYRMERDDEGRIVGAGLSLRETRHAFEVDGRRLFTWCAFDTVLFPALLGKEARVTSSCAATGARVSLRATPGGAVEIEPAGAAMSLVRPDASPDVRRAFCEHVHFFVSKEAAAGWLAAHPGAEVVAVGEAAAIAGEIARGLPGSAP